MFSNVRCAISGKQGLYALNSERAEKHVIKTKNCITKRKLYTTALLLFLQPAMWLFAIGIFATFVIMAITRFIDLPITGIPDENISSILSYFIGIAFTVLSPFLIWFSALTLRGLDHLKRQESALGICFNAEMKKHNINEFHKKHWKHERGLRYQDNNVFIAIKPFRALVFFREYIAELSSMKRCPLYALHNITITGIDGKKSKVVGGTSTLHDLKEWIEGSAAKKKTKGRFFRLFSRK